MGPAIEGLRRALKRDAPRDTETSYSGAEAASAALQTRALERVELMEQREQAVVATEFAAARVADLAAKNLERTFAAEKCLEQELENIFDIHEQVARVLEQVKRVREQSLEVEAFLDAFIENKSRARELAAFGAVNTAQHSRQSTARSSSRNNETMSRTTHLENVEVQLAEKDHEQLENFLKSNSDNEDSEDDTGDDESDVKDSGNESQSSADTNARDSVHSQVRNLDAESTLSNNDIAAFETLENQNNAK